MKKLRIEKMTCKNCLAHVKDALNALEGTGVIEAELAGKYVLVDTTADNETLRNLIEDEGYDLVEIKDI